ncbi:MAG: hypothetical protein CMP12_09850 [Zunongwangia sp.]|uniref:Asp_protease n=2 Tax=Zunongwangia profunda TaxID=398743 RepID=D5BC74_ZUNPS|nr:aspartyl protease family protein [Zunongwangia profunda]MAG85912.1 hypothetical protein [Flavobacteriaceae bacterium]MAO36197.1 hypothetical protein [Zunongwangia sp.]ADF54700.1 asp_protease [Zunongwangia profunda SM-A87]MBJ96714.1 hypothetical protein [Flavobacteriaceae bacterium]HCV81265.1 hypothetical protein [Zunongwangia profunda]
MKFIIKILKWGFFATILVLIVLIGSIFYFTSGLSELSDAKLEFHGTHDTIPFRLSNSGHILIDVGSGKEKKTYPFILDSGASNVVFERFEDDFDLNDNGYTPSFGSSGNFFWSEIKEVDQLEIGNLKLTDLNFQVTSINNQCPDAYGIIGIGVMRHMVWQIDFEKQVLIVTKELSDQKISSSDLQFDLEQNSYGHQLHIPVRISHKSKDIEVSVDLGNSGHLSLNENLIIRDSLILRSKTIFGEGSHGLGEQSKTVAQEKIYLLDTLKFSNTSFEVNNFPTSSRKGDLNLLGLGFFKKFKTTISWKDDKLILSPKDSIDFMDKMFGVHVKFDSQHESAYISTLIEDSPAQKIGIELGQKLVAVNGLIIKSNIDFCRAQSLLYNNNIVELRIIDKDTSKQYKLKSAYLFKGK